MEKGHAARVWRIRHSIQGLPGRYELRLRRLLCGKAPPFRADPLFIFPFSHPAGLCPARYSSTVPPGHQV